MRRACEHNNADSELPCPWPTCSAELGATLTVARLSETLDAHETQYRPTLRLRHCDGTTSTCGWIWLAHAVRELPAGRWEPGP